MANQEVRKNFKKLKSADKKRFTDAVVEMRKPGSGFAERYTRYAEWHGYGTATIGPYAGADPNHAVTPQAHGGPGFLPWHRVLCRLYELDLQEADERLNGVSTDKLALPYWNSSRQRSKKGKLWKDDMMGETLNGSGVVTSGPFADPWLNGQGEQLTRDPVGVQSLLPSRSLIGTYKRGIKTFDTAPYDQTSNIETGARKDWSMRQFLEGEIHNGPHGWVGGKMGDIYFSPSDPVFFLHHCFIDMLWSRWQRKNPEPINQYVSDAEITTYRDSPPSPHSPNEFLIKRKKDGSDLDKEAMRPWRYLSAIPDDYMLVYVEDVLNWQNITHPKLRGANDGYRYDKDFLRSPFVIN